MRENCQILFQFFTNFQQSKLYFFRKVTTISHINILFLVFIGAEGP